MYSTGLFLHRRKAEVTDPLRKVSACTLASFYNSSYQLQMRPNQYIWYNEKAVLCLLLLWALISLDCANKHDIILNTMFLLGPKPWNKGFRAQLLHQTSIK